MTNADTLKIVNDALDAVKLMNREWQGLNEDEFIYFTHWVDANTLAEIEQTLKKKNHG